jgi:hypothetical protein
MTAMSESRTIQEWISSLPDGELKTRMQSELTNPEETVGTMLEAIDLFSRWSNTMDGYNFWHGVFKAFGGNHLFAAYNERDVERGYLLGIRTMEAMESPEHGKITHGGGDVEIVGQSMDLTPMSLIPTSEYERLLAVERAYNLLCEESRAGVPELKWEKLHTDGSDELSVSASFMGITFYVELREDGEYDLSVMLNGELHELYPMAIRTRAIKFMEGKFREVWDNPHDADRMVREWSEPETAGN